jgi:hypothetical protein
MFLLNVALMAILLSMIICVNRQSREESSFAAKENWTSEEFF